MGNNKHRQHSTSASTSAFLNIGTIGHRNNRLNVTSVKLYNMVSPLTQHPLILHANLSLYCVCVCVVAGQQQYCIALLNIRDRDGVADPERARGDFSGPADFVA